MTNEQYDIRSMSEEEIIEFTIKKLAECERCEHPNNNDIQKIAKTRVNGNPSVNVTFECIKCGFYNDNTAEFQ